MTMNGERCEPLREEQIAAFIDGAMDPITRDGLARRIAQDPEARQLLIEAASFLDDTRHLENGALVTLERHASCPSSRRRQGVPLWAGVLAACLALAVTQPSGTMSPLDADWYGILSTNAGSEGLPAHLAQSEANVFAFLADDSSPARSFRAGVADLDRELVMHVAATSHDTTGPDHLHYSFGRWVEASRIASATGRQDFFETAGYHAALQEARVRVPLEEARVELARVATALEATRPDLPTVERAFEQIVLLY